MSGPVYLWLDLLTFLFPFALSFDQRVAFFKSWKSVILGFVFVGIPFLVWDVLFTKHGIWGFNPDYLLGIDIFNLPIEEVLFFLVVPYACTFIHACVEVYLKNKEFSRFNGIFYLSLIGYGLYAFFSGFGGVYTMVTVSCAVALIPFYVSNRKKLHYLPMAFTIALIPFFLVNGILTGAATPEPIVWYNNLENTGIRLLTIPMDDILYAWVLLSGNIFVWVKSQR